MYGSDIFPNGLTPIMLTGKKLCSFVPKSLAKIVSLRENGCSVKKIHETSMKLTWLESPWIALQEACAFMWNA